MALSRPFQRCREGCQEGRYDLIPGAGKPQSLEGGRHARIKTATGHLLQPTEIGIDVDGDPMPADPMKEGETDGDDLPFTDPYSPHPRIALSFDAEHLESVDDPSLEPVDDRIHGSFRCHAPMDDGIDDKLTWTMPRQSPPTVRGDRIESVWWRRPILDRTRAECQHFWMTHEKDCVRNSILDSKTLQTAHQFVHGSEGGRSQVDESNTHPRSPAARGPETTLATVGVGKLFGLDLVESHIGYGRDDQLCHPLTCLEHQA